MEFFQVIRYPDTRYYFYLPFTLFCSTFPIQHSPFTFPISHSSTKCNIQYLSRNFPGYDTRALVSISYQPFTLVLSSFAIYLYPFPILPLNRAIYHSPQSLFFLSYVLLFTFDIDFTIPIPYSPFTIHHLPLCRCIYSTYIIWYAWPKMM